MKKVLLLLAIILYTLFISCKNGSGKDSQKEPSVDSILNNDESMKKYYGNWVGLFIAEEVKDKQDYSYQNKININITAITKDGKVFGKSIVAGNVRLIQGEYNKTNNNFSFSLNEPGSEKYDGSYEFILFTSNDSIVGTWKAYNNSVAVTKRSFQLHHKAFHYQPNFMLNLYGEEEEQGESNVDYYHKIDKENSYVDEDGKVRKNVITYYRSATDAIYKLNGSVQKFTEADLKNLRKLDLEILRNTIYARHGYTFKNRGVRSFFDFQDWYVPVSDSVDNELSETERNNIALLKRLEKYAEDHYDTFGR